MENEHSYWMEIVNKQMSFINPTIILLCKSLQFIATIVLILNSEQGKSSLWNSKEHLKWKLEKIPLLSSKPLFFLCI
jgi:hypothetical protein